MARPPSGHTTCRAGNLDPMPAAVPVFPPRAPRRARYLIPLDTPRRREVLAALTLLAALVGLLLAQVTLGLAVAFYAIGKITRWRPVWLAVPAACGVVWVLAIGPAAALAGFLAAPRDRKSTRLNSSHVEISYAVFCLKKKKKIKKIYRMYKKKKKKKKQKI